MISTFFSGRLSISLFATRPRRTAPAVCELEGPIITGPMISKTFNLCSPFGAARNARTGMDGKTGKAAGEDLCLQDMENSQALSQKDMPGGKVCMCAYPVV